MKKLSDRLFGKSKWCSLGTLRLVTQSGTPVTVTKEIRYTIDMDGSRVYVNGYENLVHHCRRIGITYPSGRSV